MSKLIPLICCAFLLYSELPVFGQASRTAAPASNTPTSATARPRTTTAQTPAATTPAPVAAPAATPPVDPAVEAGIKNAVELFNKSDFNGSLEALKKLYAEHPNLAPPRIVFAQWFAQAELGEAVRASLEMATEETPNDPEAYLLLGEILLKQRYLTAAELLLKHASEKLEKYSANPQRKKLMQSSLLRNQMSLAETRGHWDEMVKFADLAIANDGQTATLLRQKGAALFQLKQEAQANTLFTQADKLDDPKNPQGLFADAAMSQLFSARGDRENAKKYLADALSKHPDSKEVLLLSIQSRMNEDKLDEAKTLIEKLVKDNPDLDAAKRLQATIALYLNDFPTAEKLFQMMILESPKDSQAVNGLALALCEQGNANKLRLALEYAQDNVQKNQQNSEYWSTLGWVCYKANLMEQAAAALKQSAASGQVNAATAYYLARLALQTGKTTEAKQLLQAAIASDSPFAKRRDAVLLLEELNK